MTDKNLSVDRETFPAKELLKCYQSNRSLKYYILQLSFRITFINPVALALSKYWIYISRFY